MPKAAHIEAVDLTRTVFEHINGNLGLLKFNIEELTPTNGTDGKESKKWKIICTFYESLGSTAPSRYEVNVDLNDKSVTFKKVTPDGGAPADTQRYRVTQEAEAPSEAPKE